jgi:leukotriene-A4 hydrolase
MEMKIKLEEIDWNAWLYDKGMPPIVPKFDTTLADPAYALASQWAKAVATDIDPSELEFAVTDLRGWFAGQICTVGRK